MIEVTMKVLYIKILLYPIHLTLNEPMIHVKEVKIEIEAYKPVEYAFKSFHTSTMYNQYNLSIIA